MCGWYLMHFTHLLHVLTSLGYHIQSAKLFLCLRGTDYGLDNFVKRWIGFMWQHMTLIPCFILRIYGKRLALSQYEISTKAPEGETDSSRLLVLADEPCDCADVNPSECAICSRFQIKMGAFFKICEFPTSWLILSSYPNKLNAGIYDFLWAGYAAIYCNNFCLLGIELWSFWLHIVHTKQLYSLHFCVACLSHNSCHAVRYKQAMVWNLNLTFLCHSTDSEENDDSSLDSDSELTACRCVYLSATDCDSCQNIINSLERVSKSIRLSFIRYWKQWCRTVKLTVWP